MADIVTHRGNNFPLYLSVPQTDDILADKAKLYEGKTRVWIEHPQKGYVAGEVIATNDATGQITVRTDDGKEVVLARSAADFVNPPQFDYVEDLATLSYLNEPSVLNILKNRYAQDVIHTYSGQFLLVINPYKQLPIYSDAMVQLFKQKRRDEVPPHIFVTADNAYRHMLQDGENQSILITGESGAGKTENTKKVIQYLTQVAGRPDSSVNSQGLEEQILKANPMLEAFGNAKTTRNNNSSRFGKLIEIEFLVNLGCISGARIHNYLLEKSRVIKQSKDERTFHIFYQLLQGASEKEKREWHLSSPSSYEYLKQSGCDSVKGVSDAKDFNETMDSMRVMGMDDMIQLSLFRVLSAILLLGNIKFTETSASGACSGMSDVNLQRAADLLQVDARKLDDAFCRPHLLAGNQIIQLELNKTQAADSRDALAMSLYSRIFQFLVDSVNRCLYPERSTAARLSVNLLDIAGFEIFEHNSLEQLCINYTNERLQQFFNQVMFKREQEEYQREQIKWEMIDFGLDLQPTIDLIEKKPSGILPLLEEQCVLPKASDQGFASRLEKEHSDNVCFKKPRFNDYAFILKHYAGEVTYNVDGWIQKDRDPLQADLKMMMSLSSSDFLRRLFVDVNTFSHSRRASISHGNTSAGKGKKGAKFETVTFKYKAQLSYLMDLLQATSPHFVRCIKPNPGQLPGQLEVNDVLHQLRCNGVLEGIRISRRGYPNRLPYEQFFKRYKLLVDHSVTATAAKLGDFKTASKTVMETLQIDSREYQPGLNKIFFRPGQLAELESLREQTISKRIVKAQAAWRGFLARREALRRSKRGGAVERLCNQLSSMLIRKGFRLWRRMAVEKAVMPELTKLQEEVKTQAQLLEEANSRLARDSERMQELESEKHQIMKELDQVKNEFVSQGAELQTLDSQLAALESELESEQTLRDKLNKRQAELNLQIKELQSRIEELENQVTQLQSQLDLATGENKRLKDLLNSETDARSDSDKTKRTLEMKILALQQEMDRLGSNNDQLEKSKQKVQSQLVEFQNRSEEESKKVLESERRVKKLEMEMDTLAKEKANEQRRADENESKLLAANKQIDSLSHELEQEHLIRGTVERTRQQLDTQLAEISMELEKERDTKKDLQIQNKRLSERIVELEDESSQQVHVVNQLSGTQKDLEKLLVEKNEILNQLERGRAVSEKQCRELETMLQDERKTREGLEHSVRELKKQVVDVTTRMEDESARRDVEEKSRRRLESQLREAVVGGGKALSETEALIKRLQLDNTKLQEQVETEVEKTRFTDKLRVNLQGELAETVKQLQDVETAKVNIELSYRKIKEELDDMKDRMDTEELSKTKYADMYSLNEKKIRDLENQILLLNESNLVTDRNKKTLEVKISEFERNLSAEVAKNVSYDKMIKKLKQDIDDSHLNSENELRNVQKQKEKVETELQQMKSLYDQLVRERDEKEYLLRKLEGENKNLNQLSEEQQQNIKKLEGQIKRVTADLQQSQEEIEGLSRGKTLAEQMRIRIEREMDDIRESIREYEEQNVRLNGQVKELTTALDQHRIDLDKERLAKALTEKARTELSNQLESIHTEWETDKAKFAALEKSKKIVEEDLDNIGSKLNRETRERMVLEKKNKELIQQIEDMRAALNQNVSSTVRLERERMKRETEAIHEEVNSLRESMSKLHKKNQELQIVAKTAQEDAQRDKEARLASQTEVERLKDEIDDLEEKLQDNDMTRRLTARHTKEMDELRLLLDEAQEDVRKNEKLKKTLKTQVDELTERMEDTDRSRVRLEASKKKLEQDLQAVNEMVEYESTRRKQAERELRALKRVSGIIPSGVSDSLSRSSVNYTSPLSTLRETERSSSAGSLVDDPDSLVNRSRNSITMRFS
eukprot:GILJ01003686.1.p1 GENE.GILJ01003686.1~~GILJ01003686.1.p1  ORF type:complete len:1875 (-),score=440.95 GILJ01003686.1:141-5765(-)